MKNRMQLRPELYAALVTAKNKVIGVQVLGGNSLFRSFGTFAGGRVAPNGHAAVRYGVPIAWRRSTMLATLPMVAACSAPLTMSPLDLTPLRYLLGAVGWIYWLLAIGALLLALTRPRSVAMRAVAAAAVLVVFGYLPVTAGLENHQAAKRYQKAEAMFQEHCKKSGEFIHRTVDGVEGIYVLKLRPKLYDYRSQYDPSGFYGADLLGDDHLSVFLMGRNAVGNLVELNPVAPGYRYVEAIDPTDGKRYRYTGRVDQPWLHDKRYGEWVRDFVRDKAPAPDEPPRYGVTYDEISTREDRDFWIAGSSLRVIDLKSNEVIAERIGYMMDRNQGKGNNPWMDAEYYACPPFPTSSGRPVKYRQTRDFVEKILKISKGN